MDGGIDRDQVASEVRSGVSLLDTVEVTGSIPVSPTSVSAGHSPFDVNVGGAFDVRDGDMTVKVAVTSRSVEFGVVTDRGESVECGVVGVGQGVQIALRRSQAGVAESLAYGL